MTLNIFLQYFGRFDLYFFIRTIKIHTYNKKLCKFNAPLSFRFFEFASHYMKYATSVKQFHFRISSFCYVAFYYFILLEKNKLSQQQSLNLIIKFNIT